MSNHLDTKNWFAGSQLQGDAGLKINVPAINAASASARWTIEEFERFFTTGEAPDGSLADGKMLEVIQNQTSKLTREDRQSLIRYLREDQ